MYCQPVLQTPENVSTQSVITIITKCIYSLISLFLYDLPNMHLSIRSF